MGQRPTGQTGRHLTRTAAVMAGTALLSGILASSPTSASGVSADRRTGHGPVDGAAGGGDPYFPAAGNGGYDVRHYDLTLRYSPQSRALTATARILLVPTTALRSLSLDLRDLTVSAVTVAGRPATFTQSPGEVRVTPRGTLPADRPVVVTVVYGGATGRPMDSTGALYGWVSMADGAFVANEPEGASTWYPVNDVPYDKATYTFTATVPEGTAAVGNGDLVQQRTVNGWTTWRWVSRDPMASYLAMVATGDYTITRETTADGLPIINAVDDDLTDAQKATAAARLALQPEMLEFFTARFGRYPFGSFGAVIDDDSVGYALENQTRPIYSRVPSEGTIAHELAHQWYGNSVTPRTWKDIWLNEGFATYAEWMWAEHRGRASVQESFEDVYSVPADDDFWQVPPGDPGAADLFAGAVYDRGAMTLHALRLTIGEQAFARLLTVWAQKYAGATVTTRTLLDTAEKLSGKHLDDLFTAWLYTPGKPAAP